MLTTSWPSAVLWDLDGTIVDTEPAWMSAEQRLAALLGGVWTQEDAHALIGSDLLAAGAYLKRRFDTDMSPAELADFLVVRVAESVRAGVEWRPGARELIGAFDALGVPQALVTMSYTQIADPIAARLPFSTVVTGERVDRGKPHPDAYLLAADELGVDPTQCLAIEDSPTGAAAADAAGCRVVVVPNIVQVPQTPSWLMLPTLRGQTPQSLRQWWQSPIRV